MPRQARIDAPTAIHHIICRGIERRDIFYDDIDRDAFLTRLGDILERTSTRCFAWTLLPNHFHLLLQTGSVPITTVMLRLLTGYAVVFNRRHNRTGHLFQNRYKSILCDMESYLLELVRYIHLNPLRAGILKSMSELNKYRYCGHSQVLGEGKTKLVTVDEVLSRFDNSKRRAREKYEAFVAEGIEAGRRPDLIGGGLIRSAGGWEEVMWARRTGLFLKSDERILGDSDFVETVLDRAEEHLEKKTSYHIEEVDLDQVARRVAEVLNLPVEKVWHDGKKPEVVRARALLCYWGTREVGMTATALAKRLGITQSGVSRAATRGEQLATEQDWQLK